MNDLIIKKDISKMIYNLNSIKIILDEDLASLINIDTKRLNETIRRNKEKFYEEDYFKLTLEEYKELKNATSSLTFATSSLEQYGGRRKLPYAFARDAVITLLELKIGRENSKVLEEVINFLTDEQNETKLLTNPVVSVDYIKSRIINIRGKQVILDSDLALMYQVKNGTKDINKAVKRNLKKFPEDFCFQLKEEEVNANLRFQFGTSSLKNYGGRRYLPYVFTEEGCFQLSSVLSTDIADEISIFIMRAFVAMKNYLSTSIISNRLLQNQVINNIEDIKSIKKDIKKNNEEIENLKSLINGVNQMNIDNGFKTVYFNGQIYDAYSTIMKIFESAKKNLIIIDGYADRSVLDIISKLKINVTLIARPKTYITHMDIEKYNSQNKNLKIIFSQKYHDRFFIIDKSTVYHCGTSINHAGKRAFAINKIEEVGVINKIVKDTDKLISCTI